MKKRSDYLDRISAQLEEVNSQIGRLKERSEGFPVQEKLACYDEIEALELKRQEVQRRLHLVTEASEEAWEGQKTDLDKIWDELRGSLRDTILKVK